MDLAMIVTSFDVGLAVGIVLGARVGAGSVDASRRLIDTIRKPRAGRSKRARKGKKK